MILGLMQKLRSAALLFGLGAILISDNASAAPTGSPAASQPVASPEPSLIDVNAGIIPYACKGTQSLILLAFDPAFGRRAWGAFGGRFKRGEHVWQTAAREFFEETNCAYPLRDMAVLRERAYSRNGDYYTYAMRVPYISAAAIAGRDSTSRSATPTEGGTCRDVERSRWVWVPYHALIDALDTTREPIGIPVSDGLPSEVDLWAGAASSMRSALADGVLPRSIVCGP